MQVPSYASLKRLDVDTLAKKLKRVQFITKSSADEPFGVLPHGRSVDHIIHTFQRMEEVLSILVLILELETLTKLAT